MATEPEAAGTVIERLHRAMNEHDLEALVACFAPGYRSTFPAHPARAFEGDAQVRRNWTRIFAGLHDFRAELLRRAVQGDTHWSEWRWYGTQPDGSAAEMRGVTLFGVEGDRIVWGRLYMEPLETGGGGIDAAVERLATGAPAAPQRGGQP